LGSKHQTIKDEGKTHTMPHVVSSPTAFPRTSPGPRNTVPQDTGRAQEHRRDSQPIGGAQAHRQCSGALSVLKPIGGAQAHRQCSDPLSVPGALSALGPWSVLRPITSVQAHCQCSGRSSVPRPIVSAQAHYRYSSALSCSGPLLVLTAHCQCPAHGRCPHRKPRTGAQHHAIPGPTRGCRRRQIASARSSLPLFAAPDPWR